MPTSVAKPVDLVLAGGGVKGIGLLGAVVKLMEAGYRAHRVAGFSAGSIIGALVAAAAGNAQMSPQEVADLALSLDYRKFRDPGPVQRLPLLVRVGDPSGQRNVPG